MYIFFSFLYIEKKNNSEFCHVFIFVLKQNANCAED